MDDFQEEWKPVVGYEGLYEITPSGRVRNTSTGKVLRGSGPREKYRRVMLTRGEKSHYEHIHILVARTFLGPTPEGKEVNHIDGDTKNPHEGNLEYLTHSDNNRHYWTLPKAKRGEQHGAAKLTESQVREIKSVGMFESAKSVAARFGVSQRLVLMILKGERWAYLKDNAEPTPQTNPGTEQTSTCQQPIRIDAQGLQAVLRSMCAESGGVIPWARGNDIACQAVYDALSGKVPAAKILEKMGYKQSRVYEKI